MMIATIKPYGSINDKNIQFRFEENDKYYIVDKGFNTIEVVASEYARLNCPIKNLKKAR